MSGENMIVGAGAPAALPQAPVLDNTVKNAIEERVKYLMAHPTKLAKYEVPGDKMPLGIRTYDDQIAGYGGINSISFHITEDALVPGGALAPNAPFDPSGAHFFWLRLGASTNTPERLYQIQFDNPLLKLAKPTDTSGPDQPNPMPAPIGIGKVHTGAKNTPFVNAKMTQLETTVPGSWGALPPGAEVLGNFTEAFAIDMGRQAVLVKEAGGNLAVYAHHSGLVPLGMQYKKLGDLVAQKQGTHKGFERGVEGFEPFDQGDTLTPTGYELGVTTGGELRIAGPANELTGRSQIYTVKPVGDLGPPALPDGIRFNGQDFFDKEGNKLTALQWNGGLPDLPSQLVVLDFNKNVAYIGRTGGFVATPRPQLTHTVPIQRPDALDMETYKLQPDGSCIDTKADNNKLRPVGGWAPRVADVPGESFFEEDPTKTIIGFRTGGMLGVAVENYRINFGDRAPIPALQNG
jgi:hypothetical protein